MADQLFNLNLVNEVERRPCLYNYNLTDYSLRSVVEKEWNEIGQKLNLTGNECRERWKNLRAVFIRHLKQVASTSSTKPKKPYYLAEAMQFALPYIKSLQHISTGLPPEIKEEAFVTNEEQFDSIASVSSQSHSLPALSAHSSPRLSPQSPPLSPQPKKKPKTMKYSPDKTLDFSESKKPKLEDVVDSQAEAKKMFLLSLLPDLNEMSSSETRKFKRKVLEIIDEILENNQGSSSLFEAKHNP